MKKLKIKIEDILFWLLIAGIIAVALWLLSGSPPETNALIAVTVFIAASEILLWRALFSNDKKTAVGFERVKLRFDKIDEKLEKISNQLNQENLAFYHTLKGVVCFGFLDDPKLKTQTQFMDIKKTLLKDENEYMENIILASNIHINSYRYLCFI